MSTSYSIGCRDCKQMLWIAQDGSSGRTLYSSDEDCMNKLKDFLFDHSGHNLVFCDDSGLEMESWEDLQGE